MTGGGHARVPRVRPCKRCGHWHGQTMVKVVRSGAGRPYYRAAHIEDATAWPTRHDAELDQCDAWAAEAVSTDE